MITKALKNFLSRPGMAVAALASIRPYQDSLGFQSCPASRQILAKEALLEHKAFGEMPRGSLRLYHYGIPEFSNVGDGVLFDALERLVDVSLQARSRWVRRSLLSGEILGLEVSEINSKADAVFLGGHGLFMVDSNVNNNSGWQFNISIDNLIRLNSPLVVFGVGYNRFYGQPDFMPIFSQHLSLVIEKSVFVGLRNYGSIEKIKEYVPFFLHDRIKFQPCPTTMLLSYIPSLTEIIQARPSEKIGVCLAFDRISNRFGANPGLIFSEIGKALKIIEKDGYRIEILDHAMASSRSPEYEYYQSLGFQIRNLSNTPPFLLYKAYSEYAAIVGMRGHSLMIPFGLGIPVFSINTQDKQKWFMESAGIDKWMINIDEQFSSSALVDCFSQITDNIEASKRLVMAKQEEFYRQTVANMIFIKTALGVS